MSQQCIVCEVKKKEGSSVSLMESLMPIAINC